MLIANLFLRNTIKEETMPNGVPTRVMEMRAAHVALWSCEQLLAVKPLSNKPGDEVEVLIVVSQFTDDSESLDVLLIDPPYLGDQWGQSDVPGGKAARIAQACIKYQRNSRHVLEEVRQHEYGIIGAGGVIDPLLLKKVFVVVGFTPEYNEFVATMVMHTFREALRVQIVGDVHHGSKLDWVFNESGAYEIK
jgi:hypothetical protein